MLAFLVLTTLAVLPATKPVLASASVVTTNSSSSCENSDTSNSFDCSIYVTQSDVVVAFFGCLIACGTQNITDSQGNSYNLIAAGNTPQRYMVESAFWAKASGTGVDTLTFTSGETAFMGGDVYLLSGVSTASILWSNGSSPENNQPSVSPYPPNPNGFVAVGIIANAADPYAAGTNYTIISNQPSGFTSPGGWQGSEYEAWGAGGTTNSSFVYPSSNDGWAEVSVSLAPPSSTTATSTTQSTAPTSSTSYVSSKAQASPPSVSNGQTVSLQTSLTLPIGGQAYLYGFADGGREPTTNFQYGELYSHSLDDSAGYVAADVSLTSSNTNIFSTSDAAYTVGGAEISGYSSFSAFEGDSGGNPDATSAAVTFTISAAGSLTVIVALASSQTYLDLSGPALSVAAAHVGDASSDPVEIAYGYLSPGLYTVTETTSASCSSGCEVGAASDLIVAFVFSTTPGITTGTTGSSTNSQSQINSVSTSGHPSTSYASTASNSISSATPTSSTQQTSFLGILAQPTFVSYLAIVTTLAITAVGGYLRIRGEGRSSFEWEPGSPFGGEVKINVTNISKNTARHVRVTVSDGKKEIGRSPSTPVLKENEPVALAVNGDTTKMKSWEVRVLYRSTKDKDRNDRARLVRSED